MSDKRSMPRTKKRLPCSLTVDGQTSPGIVLDVSATGVFMQTGATVAPGTKVGFELQLPDGSSMPLRATVMRRRNVPANLRSIAQGGIGLALDDTPEAYFALIEELQGPRDAEVPGAEPPPAEERQQDSLARKALLARMKKIHSKAG